MHFPGSINTSSHKISTQVPDTNLNITGEFKFYSLIKLKQIMFYTQTN